MSLSDSAATFDLADGVLTITGEIGLHEEHEFERSVKQLIKSGGEKLLLDLSQVSYMNSSCVRVVAEAFAQSGNQGIEVTVRGTARVLRLFEMVGIDKLGKLEKVDE
jgi:anti-anti-sigma factor